MARRDDIAKLRGLAGEAGYTLERAMRRNCWRLIDATGETAINPRNASTAFPVADAMAFLKPPRPARTKALRRGSDGEA